MIEGLAFIAVSLFAGGVLIGLLGFVDDLFDQYRAERGSRPSRDRDELDPAPPLGRVRVGIDRRRP